MSIFKRFWNDECGATLSVELILITTLVVVGMIVGLTTLRDSIVQEFGDTAIGVSVLNQGYSMSTQIAGNQDGGMLSDTATSQYAGGDVEVVVQVFDSNYTDNNDFCDNNGAGAEGSSVADVAGIAPACIIMNIPNVEEDD